MKTRTKLILLSLLFISSGYASTAEAIDSIGPASKHKNVFVFKTEKKFVGALVEVYNSKGELITSQSLKKRKMVIDFGGVKVDTYTIRIIKGNAKQEFKYTKK